MRAASSNGELVALAAGRDGEAGQGGDFTPYGAAWIMCQAGA